MSAGKPVKSLGSQLSQRRLFRSAFVEWLRENPLVGITTHPEDKADEWLDYIGITPVMQQVMEERAAQELKGFTAEHDDGHVNGELCHAGISYATVCDEWSDEASRFWPFDPVSFRPHAADGSVDVRRCLIKAAALLIAEAERLERVAEREKGKSDPALRDERVPTRQGGQECPRSSPEGVPTNGKEGQGDV